MIILGLTGSIGMGKSTAADLFRAAGIPVHDADATVHELMQSKGAAFTEIAQEFPEAIIDGEINRQILGQIVFADAQKLKILEAILHPKVRAKTDEFLARCAAEKHEIVVLDIPLLYETNAEKRVDVVLVVTASPEIQKQRVLARPHMNEEKFNRILQQQLSDAEKRKRADFIIEMQNGIDKARSDISSVIQTIKQSVKPQIWTNFQKKPR